MKGICVFFNNIGNLVWIVVVYVNCYGDIGSFISIEYKMIMFFIGLNV